MALRIRPLSEGSGGLTIRPLDEVLASFAPPSTSTQPATPEGMYSSFKAQSPAQQAQYADVGGGEGVGAGSGTISGPTGLDIAMNFGHLSGQSPAMAALQSINPMSLPSSLMSALGLNNTSPTPAGVLGSVFGAVAPSPFGMLTGMLAQGMQQAEINSVMNSPIGKIALALQSEMPVHFTPQMQQTLSQALGVAAPNVSLQQQGALSMSALGSLAQGLGLSAESLNAINQNATFGRGPRGGNDADPTGIPGVVGITGMGVPGISAVGDDGSAPGPGDGNGEGSAGDAGGPGAFHTGGPVGKGAPKGPERKAKLLEGEFVVRKEAAQAHRPLLEAINRGEPPKKLRKLLDYLMEPTEEKAKASAKPISGGSDRDTYHEGGWVGGADVLRSGPRLYDAMSDPNYGRGVADAPTLLNYANNPGPGALMQVLQLGLERLGSLTQSGDPNISQGAMPNTPAARAGAPLTKVMSGGKPTRVYHGTAHDFEQFDMAKAKPDALYGPGFYFTQEPQVAAGYAKADQTPRLTQLFKSREDLDAFVQRRTDLKLMDEPYREPPLVMHGRVERPEMLKANFIDASAGTAPNVRPAYLDMTKPFDADTGALDPAAIAQAAQKTLTAWGGTNATAETLLRKVRGRTTSVTYEQIAEWVGKDSANGLLRQLGYDGITHMGGAITGTPPHRVWIGFKPEQVVNPFEYESKVRAR